MAAISLIKRLDSLTKYNLNSTYVKGKRMSYTSVDTPSARTYTFRVVYHIESANVNDTNFFTKVDNLTPQIYTFADVTTAITANNSFLPGDKVYITAENRYIINDSRSKQSFVWMNARACNQVITNLGESNPNIRTKLSQKEFRFTVSNKSDAGYEATKYYYMPWDISIPRSYLTDIPYGAEILVRMTLNGNLNGWYDTNNSLNYIEWNIYPLDYYPEYFLMPVDVPIRIRQIMTISNDSDFVYLRIHREASTGAIWISYGQDNEVLSYIMKDN